MSEDLERAVDHVVATIREMAKQHPHHPFAVKWSQRVEENMREFGFPLSEDDVKELGAE
jgi:hypothetical protein